MRFARAGVVAALYVALSMATFSFASGAIQFRASEALTLLPLLLPETIPALFVGCMLSNLITGCALYDIIFGSVVTLVAAGLTYLIGRLIKPSEKITSKKDAFRIALGGIFPVLLNAFILPLIWIWASGGLEYAYMLQVAFLLASQ